MILRLEMSKNTKNPIWISKLEEDSQKAGALDAVHFGGGGQEGISYL